MDWFDMLQSSKTLCECIEPIRGDILISSDTPLLDAINIVCEKSDSIYLVLKRNEFIGWLHYDHFHKLPFRMCLFALLIDLERILLRLTMSDPTLFLKNLTPNRLKKAKETYRKRGFSLNKENKEFDSRLIECTEFCDKFTMLRKDSEIVQKFPNIKSKFGYRAEKIRNDIAHPKGGKSELLPIEKEKFIPFIGWAEKLRQQLDDYV
jgi:hypothetical protein